MSATLLDINVIIALLDPHHLHHLIAQNWFSVRTGKWATCPLTQNGFVRIVAQASYPGRMSPSEAIEMLRDFVSHEDHEFWADSISFLDPEHFDHRRPVASKHVTDLYLLALARSRGGTFVSFDRRVVADIVPDGQRHLFILA